MHTKECNIPSNGGTWCSCDGHLKDPGIVWALNARLVKRVPYLRSALLTQSDRWDEQFGLECLEHERMVNMMKEA